MSTVKQIESAIKRLDERAFGKLSGWFEELLAEKSERRFASIVATLPDEPITPKIEREIERGVRSARAAHKRKPARR